LGIVVVVVVVGIVVVVVGFVVVVVVVVGIVVVVVGFVVVVVVVVVVAAVGRGVAVAGLTTRSRPTRKAKNTVARSEIRRITDRSGRFTTSIYLVPLATSVRGRPEGV
jgi:hypothetical protein